MLVLHGQHSFMYKNSTKILNGKENLIYLPTCHSTNDFLIDLVRKVNAKSNLIVITDYQSGGRGQHGNKWESAAGKNLLCSIAIETGTDSPQRRVIAYSVGFHRVFSELKLENVKIKWPNDFYINNKKIAGQLIEQTRDENGRKWDIIGLGVNVNDTMESSNRTSLFLELDKKFDILKLALKFRDSINSLNYDKSYYYQNLLGYKQTLTYKNSEEEVFEGTIIGIDEHGRLMLKKDRFHEIRHYQVKEITPILDLLN
jgi:BirA family biotin operon repressor/biotin-[acetyl-CoA-carboxylase] ligase